MNTAAFACVALFLYIVGLPTYPCRHGGRLGNQPSGLKPPPPPAPPRKR